MMRKILSILLILAVVILVGCGIEIPSVNNSQTPEAIEHSTPSDSPKIPDDTQPEDTGVMGPVDSVLSDWVEPDSQFYPYYYLLNETQRQAYALLYTGMLNGERNISMGGFVEEDEILDVFTAVKNDHPEIFWVDCEFSHDSMINVVWTVNPVYNSHAEDLAGSQARFEAAAAEVVDAAAGMSDVEKERYVHDWLTEHVVYDIDTIDDQNAYAAIVDGRAVCAGYTLAFQYLMQRLNVPCWFCEGQAFDEETGPENHSWNIVVLDGAPYNVDVTWDDFENEDLCFTYYGYYNVNDDSLSSSHIREGLAESLAACTASGLSFEGVYGITVQQAINKSVLAEWGMNADDFISSKDNFITRVKEELISRGEGEFTLEFLISDRSLCNEIDRALSAEELEEPIFYAAAEALGLNGFSYGYSWQTTTYDLGQYAIAILAVTPSLYAS